MGESFRVLAVTDDPEITDRLPALLPSEDADGTVEVARSVAGALDRLDGQDYDGILSAYQLSESDGIRLLKTVRTERNSEIPFVMFTGNGDETVASEAVNAGVDGYVRTGPDLSAQLRQAAEMICSEIERHRARMDRRRFEDIAEQLDDPVMFQNVDGDFEVLNEAVTEFAGMSEDELIGVDEYAFMDDETAAEIESNKERVLTADAPLEYEVSPTFPEAGNRSFSTYRYPHHDENGNVDGTVAICRDVSRLKRTERELRAERNRLEEFASFVSHDLRNPLNVASGQVELAQQACESERLEKALRELERMDSLITDLLTLAREGDIVGDVEPVPFDALVARSWENVDTKDATITSTVSGTIRADPNRVATLLENLFRNAIEHGGDAVTVTVGEIDDSGFYVADDGTGLNAEEYTQLFESGYSTTTEGTGFGLAIVKQIVDAHGWEIELTDSEEGGARFEISSVEMPR